MTDVDIITGAVDRAKSAQSAADMMEYLREHAHGIYENKVEYGGKGVEDTWCWLTGGAYFQLNTQYTDSEYSSTLFHGHCALSPKYPLFWDERNEASAGMLNVQCMPIEFHLEAMKRQSEYPMDKNRVWDYLANPNASPSIYLILPDDLKRDRELAKAVYTRVYCSSWYDHLLLEGYGAVEGAECPENHKEYFLESHQEVADKLGMAEHFTEIDRKIFAYGQLHQTGERSLLLDYILWHREQNPESIEYKLGIPVRDFCRRCINDRTLYLEPRSPQLESGILGMNL